MEQPRTPKLETTSAWSPVAVTVWLGHKWFKLSGDQTMLFGCTRARTICGWEELVKLQFGSLPTSQAHKGKAERHLFDSQELAMFFLAFPLVMCELASLLLIQTPGRTTTTNCGLESPVCVGSSWSLGLLSQPTAGWSSSSHLLSF